MRTLSSALIEQKNTVAATADGPWVWLVDLARDATNTIRYARSMEDITYNSNTYTAKSMKIEPPAADMAGSTRNMILSIENVTQTMITYLEAGELLDWPAVLYLVHWDSLSTATNVIKWRGKILSATCDNQWAEIVIGNYDLRTHQVPADKYNATRCRWRFKSAECGYAGAETSCDKRYSTCDTTMSNIARFGGFPTLPRTNP